MPFNRTAVKGTPGERYAVKLLHKDFFKGRGEGGRAGKSIGLISRGWGLIKHLQFKTGGILLERGVKFNRKGGLV